MRLLLIVALALVVVPPAVGHPAHAAPMIAITKPAPVSGNVNGVPIDAFLVGPTPIELAWECPRISTYSYVTIVVRDASGAVVGQAAAPPSQGSPWSWTWGADDVGTYKLEAKVTCYHLVENPRGGPPTQVNDGSDTHARTVAAVPL